MSGSQCVYCGQPVLLLRHVLTGRAAAIDAEPDERGRITVDLAAGTYAVIARGRRRTGLETYQFHGVLCPALAITKRERLVDKTLTGR